VKSYPKDNTVSEKELQVTLLEKVAVTFISCSAV
jgi:hypothetical protein